MSKRSIVKFVGGPADGRQHYLVAEPYIYAMDQSPLKPSISTDPRLDAAFESTCYELHCLADGSFEYRILEDEDGCDA